jgi:hypothetical protein
MSTAALCVTCDQPLCLRDHNGVTHSGCPLYCQSCGHTGTDADPVTFAAGTWVHESHLFDPQSGFYQAVPDELPAGDAARRHFPGAGPRDREGG